MNHPDGICRWCGWRTKWYGPGPGRTKDGYRCMKYIDLGMGRKGYGANQPSLLDTQSPEAGENR